MGFIQLSSVVRPKTLKPPLPSVLKKTRTIRPCATSVPEEKLGQMDHTEQHWSKRQGLAFRTAYHIVCKKLGGCNFLLGLHRLVNIFPQFFLSGLCVSHSVTFLTPMK